MCKTVIRIDSKKVKPGFQIKRNKISEISGNGKYWEESIEEKIDKGWVFGSYLL